MSLSVFVSTLVTYFEAVLPDYLDGLLDRSLQGIFDDYLYYLAAVTPICFLFPPSILIILNIQKSTSILLERKK